MVKRGRITPFCRARVVLALLQWIVRFFDYNLEEVRRMEGMEHSYIIWRIQNWCSAIDEMGSVRSTRYVRTSASPGCVYLCVSVDQSCGLFWIRWRTFGFREIRKCLEQERKQNFPADGTQFSRNLTSFCETWISSGTAVLQDPNGTDSLPAAVLLPSPYCDGKALTLWRRIFFLNFSTPCIWNVNNTGTKKGSIMK